MKAAFGTYYFVLLAIFAGMLMPTQAAINNKLAETLHSSILAAFVSFVIGSLALLIYILATGIPIGNLASISGASIVSLTGGVLGAIFVASTILLVPRLGVALTFSLIIGGQMAIALVLDNFGLLGVPVKEFNVYRLIGASLVVIGVVLIRKF